MASSYSRKSNSSASNGRPTPRRAATSSSRPRTSSFGPSSSRPAGRPQRAHPVASRSSTNRQLARPASTRPSANRQPSRSHTQLPAQRTASLARRGNVSIRRTVSSTPPARPQRPVASRQRSQMTPVGRGVTARTQSPSRLKMPDRCSTGSLSRGNSRRGNPVLGAIRSVVSSIHLPQLSSSARLVASAVAAVVVVIFIVGTILFKSSLFAATDIVINGSEHISQETAQKLIDLPDDTTLLNVDSDAIVQSLKKSPWVKGVDVKREFPHKLIITPTERKVVAVAYISADNVAWAIGDDDTWIAPVSLAVGLDADGNVVDATGLAAQTTDDQTDDSSSGDSSSGDTGQDSSDASDSSDAADSTDSSSDAQDGSADASDDQEPVKTADGVTLLSGEDAARAVAQQLDAVLLTNMGTDVSPLSSSKVKGEGLAAALKYIAGFSPDFLKQIKSFSVPSVQALACNLKGGVEVSLGDADDIQKKERIVTKLLEEQTGVTYINVRTPDAYTYRSVDL